MSTVEQLRAAVDAALLSDRPAARVALLEEQLEQMTEQRDAWRECASRGWVSVPDELVEVLSWEEAG